MTQFIKLCYRNILGTGTVTVTSENASFPKYRLYDLAIGKLFKGTAFASPFAIIINQGAVISYEVDRLIIPAGHNLNGLVCSLRYSTDNFGSDDHEAIGWTQVNALIIDKEFTAATKQYWKLNITAPATIVEMPEMFLTKSYELERNANYGCIESYRDNVDRQEAGSGIVYKAEMGDIKKYRKYFLTRISSSQKSNLEAAGLHLGITLKPLYVEDLQGTVFFAELLKPMEMTMERENRYGTEIEALEMLGATT
jgi:hypothetical protein